MVSGGGSRQEERVGAKQLHRSPALAAIPPAEVHIAVYAVEHEGRTAVRRSEGPFLEDTIVVDLKSIPMAHSTQDKVDFEATWTLSRAPVKEERPSRRTTDRT